MCTVYDWMTCNSEQGVPVFLDNPLKPVPGAGGNFPEFLLWVLLEIQNDQRQIAMKHDPDHCDPASLARCINKLPDCGTRADRSTAGRTVDGRSGRAPDNGRSSEERLSERTTNSGDRADVSDSATATIFPLTLLPPIIGASIAT